MCLSILKCMHKDFFEVSFFSTKVDSGFQTKAHFFLSANGVWIKIRKHIFRTSCAGATSQLELWFATPVESLLASHFINQVLVTRSIWTSFNPLSKGSENVLCSLPKVPFKQKKQKKCWYPITAFAFFFQWCIYVDNSETFTKLCCSVLFCLTFYTYSE